jgi:hypothetical protein
MERAVPSRLYDGLSVTVQCVHQLRAELVANLILPDYEHDQFFLVNECISGVRLHKLQRGQISSMYILMSMAYGNCRV